MQPTAGHWKKKPNLNNWKVILGFDPFLTKKLKLFKLKTLQLIKHFLYSLLHVQNI